MIMLLDLAYISSEILLQQLQANDLRLILAGAILLTIYVIELRVCFIADRFPDCWSVTLIC